MIKCIKLINRSHFRAWATFWPVAKIRACAQIWPCQKCARATACDWKPYDGKKWTHMGASYYLSTRSWGHFKSKIKIFHGDQLEIFSILYFYRIKNGLFFISNAILTMIDCSNMFGNCLNQLSIPKSMGLDT